jgi:hypothetical protein
MFAVKIVTGSVLLGIVGGAIWGIMFLLETMFKVMGDGLQYLIWVPLILLVAYFAGCGYSDYKVAAPVKHGK